MAVPIFAVAGGLQALGGLFQLGGALKDNKRQARYLTRLGQEVADEAQASATFQYSGLNRADTELQQQAAQQIMNIVRQGQQAGGMVQAQAAAGGVEGASVQALQSDVGRQTMSRILASEQTLDARRTQLDSRRQAVASQAKQRIQSVIQQQEQLQDVDVMGQLFNIGASMFSSYLATSTPNAAGSGRTLQNF